MARAKQPEALAKIIVERFRVFRERTEIEIGPLTILAGANSSGKSSAMMAPLLLKQTLDAPFDPGPLLLNGGHVSVTSFDDQLRCASVVSTPSTTSPLV
ncbi:MAG: ATP-binding protein, partial [Sandaracinaceae bacterium]|nr:ATP-binding protein [Sandaracinaceae bacterium]